MKPAAPGRALLCALGLAVWLSCARGLQSSGSHDWKKLIMVHHWPATVCKSTEHGCREPPDYWTIHGLWADKADMCNRSWPFRLEEIKDLMPDMKVYWPDLLHASPNSSFLWRHEWEKHGTCVAQLEALGSERKYFGKALDLYRALALNSALQKLGVVPSGGNYYQVSDLRDALTGLYGVPPKIQCLPPHQGQEVQLLGQIELCFTKDLQLRGCAEPGEPGEPAGGAGGAGRARDLEVCEDGPVFYPPPP